MEFLLKPAKGGWRSFAAACLVVSPAMFASSASALEYKFGDLNLQLDTIVSASAAMRAGKQSCENISVFNGGCLNAGGYSWSVNDDDGNVNVERGDVFSAPVKVLSELSGQWENYGFYISGKAFYDTAVRNLGEGDGNYGPIPVPGTRNPAGAAPQMRSLKDAVRGDTAYEAALKDMKLLDAYAYGNWDLAGMPLNIRLGRQVASWGESTFIQGGVSSYLPLDVAALYQPGLELKEVFLPQGTAYASLGLPSNFTLETMYVFERERSELPACGTMFSVSDVLGEGCAYAASRGEFWTQLDGSPPAVWPYVDFGSSTTNGPPPLFLPRASDRDARSDGEWGLALRYYADWMGQGTDIGAYFVNFHSKLPIAGFTSINRPGNNPLAQAAGFCGNSLSTPGIVCTGNFISYLWEPFTSLYGSTAASSIATAYGIASSTGLGGVEAPKTVFAQYPEDIKMFGTSFNTSITFLPRIFGDGTALSGDLAYYPDMPFQVDPLELAAHDLAASGFVADPGDAPIYAGQMVGTLGADIPGSRTTEALHGSLTTISTLTPSNWFVKSTGGDFAVLVANLGFQYLPNADQNRFAVFGNRGHANPWVTYHLGDHCVVANVCANPAPRYADTFSTGYRLYAYQDYHSAFGTGVTISPKLYWSHDVKGYSAGPIGPGFIEGKKALMVGVDATYQGYKVGLSYTHHTGNKDHNRDYDKDFVALTASYAF